MEALSILLVSAEMFVIVGFLGKYIVNLFRDRKNKMARLHMLLKG
jgi:hypothetical protein